MTNYEEKIKKAEYLYQAFVSLEDPEYSGVFGYKILEHMSRVRQSPLLVINQRLYHHSVLNSSNCITTNRLENLEAITGDNNAIICRQYFTTDREKAQRIYLLMLDSQIGIYENAIKKYQNKIEVYKRYKDLPLEINV